MRTPMLLTTGLIVLAGTLLGTVAHAGFKSDSSVYITSTTARGSVHDARFNAGSTEYIGCSYESYQTSGGYLYCSARTTGGAYRSCYQYSPSTNILAAVSSIGESSFIEFRKDGANRCTMVIVRNFSYYL